MILLIVVGGLLIALLLICIPLVVFGRKRKRRKEDKGNLKMDNMELITVKATDAKGNTSVPSNGTINENGEVLFDEDDDMQQSEVSLVNEGGQTTQGAAQMNVLPEDSTDGEYDAMYAQDEVIEKKETMGGDEDESDDDDDDTRGAGMYGKGDNQTKK